MGEVILKRRHQIVLEFKVKGGFVQQRDGCAEIRLSLHLSGCHIEVFSLHVSSFTLARLPSECAWNMDCHNELHRRITCSNDSSSLKTSAVMALLLRAITLQLYCCCAVYSTNS